MHMWSHKTHTELSKSIRLWLGTLIQVCVVRAAQSVANFVYKRLACSRNIPNFPWAIANKRSFCGESSLGPIWDPWIHDYNRPADLSKSWFNGSNACLHHVTSANCISNLNILKPPQKMKAMQSHRSRHLLLAQAHCRNQAWQNWSRLRPNDLPILSLPFLILQHVFAMSRGKRPLAQLSITECQAVAPYTPYKYILRHHKW